jgi:cation diffusion facilitator CzcD-associated flavoprotein CzcO
MNYSLRTQTPAPRGSTMRVSRHPNAYFHFDAAVETVKLDGDEIIVATSQGKAVRADFLILGTGFGVDPLARKELDGYADKILLWQDRFTPPAGQENEQLGKFPYLSEDFSFREREPGQAPWLANIHSFNSGAAASLGKVSGDIPGIRERPGWYARSPPSSMRRISTDTGSGCSTTTRLNCVAMNGRRRPCRTMQILANGSRHRRTQWPRTRT